MASQVDSLGGLRPRRTVRVAPAPRTITIGPSVESLSYSTDLNQVALRRMRRESAQRRRLYGYSGRTLIKLLTTLATGVVTGLTAVALSESIENLVLARDAVVSATLSRWYSPAAGAVSLLPALGLQLAISIVAAVAAAAAVQLLAPKAAGAGVTLVMAYLNGNDIPDVLTLHTYAVKFLGNVAARVAGLALGPEGPMIHLGACVASVLSATEDRLWNWATLGEFEASRDSSTKRIHRQYSDVEAPLRPLPRSPSAAFNEAWQPAASVAEGGGGEPRRGPLQMALWGARHQRRGPPCFTNADHREMVSAGAAAGLAAAFGAPIGGVLFSLEEACSHWSRNTGWRCFLAAAVASFTLSQLHPRGRSGILGFGWLSSPDNHQWLVQMPFIVLVSAVGGLLGAGFNVARAWLMSRSWKPRRDDTRGRLLEAALVATFTIITIFASSLWVGTCLDVPKEWRDAGVMQFNCPAGQYNDLATVFLSTSVWVIRSLLGLGSEAQPVPAHCSISSPCYFTLRSLSVASVLYVVLMVLAAGTASPGGLFMPSIMAGATAGGAAGLALHALAPPAWGITPGTFAIVCATATLGGVFHSSISLVVIVVEGTRGIDFMFGIIVAVVISNTISKLFLRDGLYEGDLERDGTVFYLRHEPPHALRYKTAADIMATPPAGLNTIAPMDKVLEALCSSTHSAFVVYDDSTGPDPPLGAGRFAGLILRSQLMTLLRHGVYCDAQGRYLGVPPDDVPALEEWLAAEMEIGLSARRGSTKLVRVGGGKGPRRSAQGPRGPGAQPPSLWTSIEAGRAEGRGLHSPVNDEPTPTGTAQDGRATAVLWWRRDAKTGKGAQDGSTTSGVADGAPGPPGHRPQAASSLPLPTRGTGANGVLGDTLEPTTSLEGVDRLPSMLMDRQDAVTLLAGLRLRPDILAADAGASGVVGPESAREQAPATTPPEQRSDGSPAVTGSDGEGGRASPFQVPRGAAAQSTGLGPQAGPSGQEATLDWRLPGAVADDRSSSPPVSSPTDPTDQPAAVLPPLPSVEPSGLVDAEDGHDNSDNLTLLVTDTSRDMDQRQGTLGRAWWRLVSAAHEWLGLGRAPGSGVAVITPTGSSHGGTERPHLARPPRGAHLNLAPFMACAPLSVRTATPASVVHSLFLRMSLRHLPVVDRYGVVWGMITRKDLDRAAGRGWWRLNDPPPEAELASPIGTRMRLAETREWLSHLAARPSWLTEAVRREGLRVGGRFRSMGSRDSEQDSVRAPLLGANSGRSGGGQHDEDSDAESDKEQRHAYLLSIRP